MRGRVTRKTVSVLFCDLVESSELFERLDPEALRAVNERYYAAARAAVESHGGTVEKYIGDAVMAVFGIPQTHEDDALRAVRAAVEIRTRVGELGLVPRIGIETGEVVAGDPAPGHAFVTGPAVVVAERLQKEAGAHGILAGEAAYGLVRDAVVVEPAGELALKGKTQPVKAWRVHEVHALASGLARRLDAPLVGREEELESLRAELRLAEEEARCRLVPLIGPAGAGKSRLVLEFTSGLERARAVSARCPRYGEGTTFRPVVDIVADAWDERVEATEPDAHELRVLGALKDRDPSATADEIGAAFRRFLEALAARRSLVVVLEDVESAEAGLLDLIEYLVRSSEGFPILIVCVARAELLEERPVWADGSVVHLEPLSEDDSLLMIDGLAGGKVDPVAARRIVEIARGNPLFAEELLRMLVDEGALRREGESWIATRILDGISPPGSVQAVLEARLDLLEPDDRSVVQSAAVIGQEFWRTALAVLEERDPWTLDAHLAQLAAKQLITPTGQDAFTFGHPLIREVAYASLPKAERADLHERFAHWVEGAGFGVDLDETVGHHLYSAVRARLDLDPSDERAAALAAEALPRLEAAAKQAVTRQDNSAAVSFLERTEELLPVGDPRRLDLMADLGEALMNSGRFEDAEARLRDTAERAAELGLSMIARRASLDCAVVRWFTSPTDGVDSMARAAEAVIEHGADDADTASIAHAWSMLALTHWARCEIGEMQNALEQARPLAQASGSVARRSVRRLLALAAVYGPTPAVEGLRLCAELTLEEQVDGTRAGQAYIDICGSVLEAMAGRFEAARDRCSRVRPILEELGQRLLLTSQLFYAGRIELFAGDPVAAERCFREGVAMLETLGDRGGNLVPLLVFLGVSLHAQERTAQAEEAISAAGKLHNAADLEPEVVAAATLAEIRLGAGRSEEAEALARRAVAVAERTDAPIVRADALRTLALVLRETGARAESVCVARRAVALYEAKGSSSRAAATRALLADEGVTSR